MVPVFAQPRAAAGVLFTNESGEVLFVYPSYKDYLDVPGGYVEPGETPYEAAQREVYEELSIKPAVGRLLVVDWRLDSPEVEGGSKMLFVFDGGTLSVDELDRLAVDGEEIIGWRFHSETDWDGVTIPRLANRIRHATQARSEGSVAYLENGLRLPVVSEA